MIRDVHIGSGSRIRILIFYPSRIRIRMRDYAKKRYRRNIAKLAWIENFQRHVSWSGSLPKFCSFKPPKILHVVSSDIFYKFNLAVLI
jgi:hypothetical protein